MSQVPHPAAPKRTLLGFKQPGRPGRIVVWDTDEIAIGRAPESDIVLDDSDVSRQHALLVRSPAGCEVRDLGTSNGTSLNGQPLHGTSVLASKDVIQIADVQITFIVTAKDPGGLGLEVVYASALKSFGPATSADPGATMIGLTDIADDPEASGPLKVDSVGGFGFEQATPTSEPESSQASARSSGTRDLDLEFADFVPQPAAQTASDVLSLHLELEGLTPDLRRALEAFVGKVVELPSLRIRIRGDDA